MIQLQQVTKIFEDSVRAVDDVSFTVQEGEIFGLIGTSGCGKTTTLKLINRLVDPAAGKIFVNGQNVQTQSPEKLRRNIGYVIQSVGLFPHYSIAENIAVVPRLLKWDPGRIDQRIEELLKLVGLEPSEFAARRPESLSGGQQQRVGFARALAADPAVILMDEPFGALDPITKEQIRDEFKKLLHQINKTIVLVTHDVAEAFDLCGRVALMNAGNIQQVGSPRDLLLNPANEFVASFFDVKRLELEMQTITVDDLLGIASQPQSAVAPQDIINVRPQTSVAEVLNRREIVERKVQYIAVEDGSSIEGYLKVDELFSGFYQLREKIRGQGHG